MRAGRAFSASFLTCLCLAILVVARGEAHAAEETSAPAKAAAEASAADDAGTDADDAIGRPCDKAFNNCPAGLACVQNRCGKPRLNRDMETKSVGVVYVDRTRPFRLGVANAFHFGLGGKIDNPSPAYSVSADFGFPTGRNARWHLEIGYQDLADHHGIKFSPFVLGYTIPVYHGPVDLEIEVLAAVVQSEVLFGDGFAVALSSGLRSQLVLVYGLGWASFAPLGFEVRYAYGVENVGITTGAGVNWPLVLTVGIEL